MRLTCTCNHLRNGQTEQTAGVTDCYESYLLHFRFPLLTPAATAIERFRRSGRPFFGQIAVFGDSGSIVVVRDRGSAEPKWPGTYENSRRRQSA